MIYNNFNKFDNINNYKKLGEGTFGDVYYYKNIVYKMYKDGNGYGIPYDTIRELLTYFYLDKILNAPIPNFFGIVLNPNEAGLIIQRFSSTLYKLDKQYINKYYISIAKQLISAVCTYSLYGFVHRDIKPNNILFDIIDNEPIVKIIDWGSSRYKRFYIDNLDISNDVCTLFTRSPEVIKNKLNSATSVYDSTFHDIWSCAVSLIYIWEPKKYLFNEDNEQKQLNIIYQTLNNRTYSEAGDYILEIPDKNLIDLLDKMVVIDIDKRINIEEILDSPFMLSEKTNILENVRESGLKSKFKLCEGHLSNLRCMNIEWLINIVKLLGDTEFQMPILLSIFIIDELIFLSSKTKLLINKTTYLATYLLSAELLKPKSVKIEAFSSKTKIAVSELVKMQILIINKIPYIYDLIDNSPIIEVLDENNNIEVIKITLLLIIYYTDTYYNNKNNISELIMDIYTEKIKLNMFKPLFNYNISIINN